MLRKISRAIFPPNRRVDELRGYDRTHLTEKNVFYYPITASLGASPNVWFKNLRLLQIRKALRLVSSLQVSLSRLSHFSREIYVKMEALKETLGKEMMVPTSIPQMKAKLAISSPRAESLRSAGLAARNTRNLYI